MVVLVSRGPRFQPTPYVVVFLVCPRASLLELEVSRQIHVLQATVLMR